MLRRITHCGTVQNITIGSLAQLVERHVYTVDVIGSIPVGPTLAGFRQRSPAVFNGKSGEFQGAAFSSCTGCAEAPAM